MTDRYIAVLTSVSFAGQSYSFNLTAGTANMDSGGGFIIGLPPQVYSGYLQVGDMRWTSEGGEGGVHRSWCLWGSTGIPEYLHKCETQTHTTSMTANSLTQAMQVGAASVGVELTGVNKTGGSYLTYCAKVSEGPSPALSRVSLGLGRVL